MHARTQRLQRSQAPPGGCWPFGSAAAAAAAACVCAWASSSRFSLCTRVRYRLEFQAERSRGGGEERKETRDREGERARERESEREREREQSPTGRRSDAISHRAHTHRAIHSTPTHTASALNACRFALALSRALGTLSFAGRAHSLSLSLARHSALTKAPLRPAPSQPATPLKRWRASRPVASQRASERSSRSQPIRIRSLARGQ
jgi:hypothetical protein